MKFHSLFGSGCLRSVLMVALLFSCNHLKNGKIIAKHYEEPRRYIVFTPIMAGKLTVLVPHIIYDDEDWVLTVEGIYDGEKRVENVYVSPACYRQNVGDYWTKDQDCSYTDDNNTKTRQ